MREKLKAFDEVVKTIRRDETGGDGKTIRTLIEKTFENKSKKDREIVIHKALEVQNVTVLPVVPDEEGRIIYVLPKGETAYKLLKELSEMDIESEEWFEEKEFIVGAISEWLTCFYLALYLTFSQKWILGKFDLNDFIFDEAENLYFTDFEECTTGSWEEEIADFCREIMMDERIDQNVRNEVARSFRAKMIRDLNLDKTKVNHFFLRSSGRVR